VDCDANPELKDRFAVKSFPTILYFEGEEHVEWKGGREEDSIMTFLMKR